MLEIYQELTNLMQKGGRAVLATVISSEGSAPRNAGAKMLMRSGTSYANSCVSALTAPILEYRDVEYQPPRKKVSVGIVNKYRTTIRSPLKAYRGFIFHKGM